MCSAIKRKKCSLSIRLPATDIATIDRAATLLGLSRTEFVRDAAVQAAQDVLVETIPIRMSSAGFNALVAALSAPASAVPELVEVFQRVAPWDRPKADS